MVAAIRRRVDDGDLYDDDGNGPYDKRYPGQRVIGDRGRVRVPIMLSDAMPPEYRAAMSMSLQRNDAARHRPHQLVSDSAELRDAEREAARAYDERNDFLRDAWRSPSNPSPPDHDDDGLSPRDQYVERITSAWRAPPRRNDPSDDVEAL